MIMSVQLLSHRVLCWHGCLFASLLLNFVEPNLRPLFDLAPLLVLYPFSRAPDATQHPETTLFEDGDALLAVDLGCRGEVVLVRRNGCERPVGSDGEDVEGLVRE